MSLISIIVPVYNIQEYLSRCIDSIINQTYKNIEIILVDDGSTDKSGTICDEYAGKDNRIIVIHKENGGVSSARNAGLDIAKGDYIGFVDGDDYIEKDMYQVLIDDALQTKSQISCCQIKTYNIDNTESKTLINDSCVIDKEDIINGFFFDEFIKGFIVSPCNKIISKNVIGNIKFKDYALGEDFLFIFEILKNTDSVSYNSFLGYYYCHRENSAMTSKFSSKRFDYIYAITEIEKICKEYYDKNVQKKAHQWIFGHTLVNYRSLIINQLLDTYPQQSKEYKKYLKDNKACFYDLQIKRKLDYILSLYFPFAYKFLKK